MRNVEDEGVFFLTGCGARGEDVAGIHKSVVELRIAGNLFDDECSLPGKIWD